MLNIINDTPYNLMKGFFIYDYFKNLHLFKDKRVSRSRESVCSRHSTFNYTSSEQCTDTDTGTDIST